MRLSAELLTVRDRLTANDVSPLERVRLAARGLEIRALLGDSTPPQREPVDAPAIALTGNEFGEFPDTPEGKKELRAAAKAYLEGMRGQMVNCPVLGAKVEIRQRGIKETLAFSGNPKKLKLMHAIPQIIATATAAVREDNHKKAKKPFVEAYFYLKSTVALGEEQIALHVVVEQDDKGRLYYDLMIDPPKEKAMLDSCEVSPDNYSGLPQEQDIASESKGSPDHYSGHLLNASVGQVSGAVMLDDVGGLVLNLFLDGDVEQGEATNESAPATDPLVAELEAAKAEVAKFDKLINAGALTKPVLAALDRHSAAWKAVRDRDEAQAWEAGKARDIGTANSKPHFISAKEALTPAGAIKSDAKNSKADSAIWYYQGDVGHLAFSASVTIGGQKDAGADRAAHILERLRAAKGQGYRLVNYRAGSLGTVWVLTTADGKGFVSRAGFEEMVNPVFARPDMPESAPGFESMQAQQIALAKGFLGWLDTLDYDQRHNQGVVARKITSTRIGQWLRMTSDGLGQYIQYVSADNKYGIRIQGADFDAMVTEARKLAVMPEIEPEAPPVPEANGLTAKGNPLIDEAVLADLGLIREVFGRWKYRYAVGAPELFATTKEGAIEQGSDAYAKADPSELLTKEQRWEKSNADFYADFDARYGKMSIDQVRAIMEAAKPDPVSHAAAVLREFNGGGRRTGPAVTTQGAREGAELARQLERYLAEREAKEGAGTGVADPDAPKPVEGDPPPVAPVPDIVEYKTRKDKILRGIIRTDLTLEQAKAIDPYTWKMNGGYFIREKHLGEETSHILAAPAPVVLTAEQQAEAVATAQRQAEQRAKEALATQVEKLRQVANKAIDNADASLNSDRKTNTSKRAREAGYAIEKASTDKAAAQTLNRLADSIEAGAGGLLAKLSSRAQLDELQRIMRRAMSDADSKLAYGDQLSRRGRPFDDNDLKFVTYPRPEAWSNRYSAAAKTLATKSAKGNSRLIAALAKLGDGRERFALDDAAIALTRKGYAELKKVKEGWDLADPIEAIGRADRLARMGITDRATLEAAIQELIPHLVEKAQEDPVKKAERAIIGQKVGIDFFPTPAHVAQRMARMANIREGMRVLEPSAGNGNLADAAKAEGAQVDVIEISSQLRDILTAKGYTVVDHDFDGFTPEKPYDAILMNPPFSQRRDAAHIMRAFDMLASGGTLVAIAGEGVFFGSDQKAVAFREWLDTHEADVEALDGGTFKDNALLAQTSANARLIMLRK
jgi:protein-L-isoaspartate O-methyltransferase